ncbi:hypothetical protein CLAIMM_09446 isoform 1 [Cladophialophora immunda]|nr:hypothetical protein CLAIMM_09446 isoform 1 [Cladophialophora immunda]
MRRYCDGLWCESRLWKNRPSALFGLGRADETLDTGPSDKENSVVPRTTGPPQPDDPLHRLQLTYYSSDSSPLREDQATTEVGKVKWCRNLEKRWTKGHMQTHQRASTKLPTNLGP